VHRNREVHPVTVKFKMFHTDKDKKKREYWMTYRTTFSYPVLKSFHRFSSSVQKNEIVYTFFDENEDFNDVEDPYKCILDFLEYINFVDSTNNRKNFNNLTYKNGSLRNRLHTPDKDSPQIMPFNYTGYT
jgi:hypothetical protein